VTAIRTKLIGAVFAEMQDAITDMLFA
jgi:protein transport protein SEC24